ncbi:hypothetical protein D3C76_876250 [compost metagenome]
MCLGTVVQIRIKPCVPLAYCQEQCNRCKNRFTEWQDDFVINRKVICTVQFRRFLKRIRQSVNKGTNNEYVERTDHAWQYIHPERTDQVQVTHQDVDRNQTPGEIHRKCKCSGYEFSQFEVRTSQCKGDHRGTDQTEQCTYNRTHNGNLQTLQQPVILEDRFVVLQCKFPRPQVNSATYRIC